MDTFKSRFPDIETREPKWASIGAVAEFRKMDVGDITLFPIERYKYNTIRNIPTTSLAVDVLMEGKAWSTTLDKPNKCVAVMRTA